MLGQTAHASQIVIAEIEVQRKLCERQGNVGQFSAFAGILVKNMLTCLIQQEVLQIAGNLKVNCIRRKESTLPTALTN